MKTDNYTDQKKQLKERGRRLQKLRGLLGFNVIEFGEKYGLGVSTVRQWEHGRLNGLSEKGARKIIELAIHDSVICSLEWLYWGIGQPPQLITDNQATLGQQELSGHHLYSEKIIESEISQFLLLNLHSMTMKVNDNAMEPYYFIGDYVGGQQYGINEIEELIGKTCIVQTHNNQLLLRELLRNKLTGKHELYSPNPNCKERLISDVSIINIAPVTRLWRTVPH